MRIFFKIFCVMVLSIFCWDGNSLQGRVSNKEMNKRFKLFEGKLDQEIQKGVARELDQKTSVRSEFERCETKLDQQIKVQVSREIDRQTFGEKRKKMRRWVYAKKGELVEKPDSAFIYKLPAWPFYSLFYEQKDLFQVELNVSDATQAYSSGGRTRDASMLAFGKDNIEVQDILLVSKLAKQSKFRDKGAGKNHADLEFFKVLADQKLNFDGSITTFGGSLNFARHFRGGDISFGLQVPFLIKRHNLRLESELDEAKIAKRDAAGCSFKGMDLQQIFEKILEEKGMSFDDRDRESGLGDISVFFHYQIPTKKCERLVVGLNLVVPSARERKWNALWAPELGNGGWTKLECFASMLFGWHRLWNPYVHANFSFSFPASVDRRVPKKFTYDGCDRAGGLSPDDAMVLAKNVQLIRVCPTITGGTDTKPDGTPYTTEEASVSEFDSTVRSFADNVHRTKIRRGPEFFARLGNVFERVFTRRAFLDVFYDVRLKAKDYLGFKGYEDLYDAKVWTDNTFQLEHRVGLDLSYQFDSQIRVALGGMYSFEGRNVPKAWQAHFNFNAEF